MKPLRVLTMGRSPLYGHLIPASSSTAICVLAFAITTCVARWQELSEIVPGDREAVIRWSEGETSSDNSTMCAVSYRPLRSLLKNCPIVESEREVLTVPEGLGSVTLSGLRPYTLYSVFLLFHSRWFGIVRPPMTATFTTKEAAPDGPPRDLRRSGSSTSFEQLSWSEVECHLANGEVRSYYVRLHSDDAWETETHEGNATSTVCTFSQLAPFTRYTAKVFAQNGAGRSRYFASLNFTTDPIPPPQPTDLLASDVSQESVRVSWNAPYPPHGELDHYRLRYWRGDDTSKATEVTVAHEECRRRRSFTARHCYTVKGLERGSTYHFSVRAMNKGTSLSPYSMELVIKTKDSGPPRDLHFSDRTETSLRILWYAADGRDEESATYMVNSSLVHTFNETLSQVSAPQSSIFNGTIKREFYLSGLFPGSTYLVCVQENTAAGFGEAACANFSTRPSVPVVKRAPRVEAVDGTTVTLALAPVDFQMGPLTAYYLLVVKKVHEVVAPIRLVNFSVAEDSHLGYYVAAIFTPEEVSDGTRFVVGAGGTAGPFVNPPLEAGAPYSFGWAVQTTFSGETLYGYRLTAPVLVGKSALNDNTRVSASFNGLGDTYWPFIAGSLLCLTVVTLAAAGITCYCRRRRSTRRWPPENISSIELEQCVAESPKSVQQPEREIDCKAKRAEMNEYIVSMDAKPAPAAAQGSAPSHPSNPVPVKRFREYVAQALVEGSLQLEYKTLTNGMLRPALVTEKSDTKSKKGDGNSLSSDHSRVLLTGGEVVDDIDASYVPDFRNPRRYIAAHSPVATTSSGFWQMVWQENISKVVALSEPKEEEEVIYCPKSRENYGDVTVTPKKMEPKADFAVQELEVSTESETRTVMQFHYKAWPRGKMPPFTDSLESFITTVRCHHPDDTHPILVHSRSGAGRSGTFILIDSMISQAQVEGEVDCLRQLHSMRRNRMNIVGNEEQYIGAHKVLVNMVCTKSKKMTIEDFLKLYEKLKATHPATGKSPMSKEFEELNRIRPHPQASEYRGARDERNTCKNRSQKILAADSRRPLLDVTLHDSKTDYINAVHVDGFRKPNAFVVTQMPLNATMNDFWEMATSSGSITLVTLGPLPDETTPMFWPDFNSTAKYGKVTVEHMESTGFPGLVVRSFKICQSNNSPRILKQFHCSSWNRLESVPGSHECALDLLRRVDQWQMRAEGAPVIVQCLDGCQECGLYCVMASVCEQLKLEHEVDVFRCVQRVRESRPEFIVRLEQYVFCYEVAHLLIDSFGTYSNFSG